MMSIKKYTLHDLKNILFLALFTFPILPIKLCNWIFILFSITVLILFFKEKKTSWFNDLKFWLMITLPFLPYLIELSLFPHNAIIQFETEKKILFFIAPFIFYCSAHLNKKLHSRIAIHMFVGTVSFLSLFSFTYLAWTWKGALFQNADEMSYQIRTNFEMMSGLHPTYFGLFSAISSVWLIYSFNTFAYRMKPLIVLALLFLISLNILLASKMALFILLVGTMYILYKSSLKNRQKISFVILMSCGITAAIYFVPSLNSRLSEIPSFLENQTPHNTLVERQVIYNCNTAIMRTDVLFGSGARNAQALLDYCYTWCGFHKGAIVHLNSHNQYFTFALNYGILLLMLFCGVIVLFIFISRQSVFANLFWISIIFIMLSESILERQMGIYYFLFFAFLFHSESTSPKILIPESKA